MNIRIARFLSICFHPLLLPTLLGANMFLLTPSAIGLEGLPVGSKLILLAFLFLYTFLAPSAMIYWLYRSAIIKNLEMTDLKDRRLPFMLTAGFYAFVAYSFHRQGGFFVTIAQLLSIITLVIALVSIVSFYWQISAHTAGMGGLLGFSTYFYQQLGDNTFFFSFLTSILLLGIVATARLKLNAHTPIQVIAGAVLGFVICIFGMTLFQ